MKYVEHFIDKLLEHFEVGACEFFELIEFILLAFPDAELVVFLLFLGIVED